jgi:protein-S-isoprenylcysteine O-methyltransferase Ste14
MMPLDSVEWLRLATSVFWSAADAMQVSPRDLFAEISPMRIANYAWLALGLYWLWAARNQKKVQNREPLLARLLHVAYMVGGFLLLYTRDPRLAALNRRFLPDLPWIAMLGALLTVVGVAFAIWARNHIGRNWSGQVTIRKDHELIRSGPYARIRHPIYTGMLVAVAGTAIAIGEYRAIVAFALIAIGFVIKAKREESLLSTEFGSSFDEHRRQTGFFLPH